MGKYGKESENAPQRCRTFASAKGAGVHSGGRKIISDGRKKNSDGRNEDYDRRHRHPSRSNGHLGETA